MGLLLQRGGHRGDRIGAGEGVADGRRVAGIVAEERGVRTVQRGDHARSLLRREHGAGEDGRGGVGHRVVHVEQVQPVIPRHLGHAHRERQGVVGKLEHVVVVDGDGMEVQSRPVPGQAERPLVADEMHLVAPVRQVHAQRGGQGAAASHRREAADADAQRIAASHVSRDARGGGARETIRQPGSSV
jgi:hypothetical protein